jgi:hypothetical protein
MLAFMLFDRNNGKLIRPATKTLYILRQINLIPGIIPGRTYKRHHLAYYKTR